MSTKHLALRRLATAVGVVAVLALGYGSIRAASAWTAASAPLTVAPVSVRTLQANLADEQARSEALTQQLQALDARSQDLETALSQAQERIDSDATHAGDLEQQLAEAKAKLAKMEASIAKAKKALAAQVAAAKRAAAAQAAAASRASTTSSGHSGEDEHEHEHGDDDD